jgi:N6-adenosine-specific RNA methylase IME4
MVIQPFRTVVVDPPWPYRKVNHAEMASDAKMKGYVGYDEPGRTKYATLDLPGLAALPIGDLVADYVFLWTTGPFLPAGLDLLKAWGFEYVTMLSWLKTTPGGNWAYGAGYWYRGAVENILVGKRKNSVSIRTHKRNIFEALRIGHSTKPEWLQDHIEEFFPGPYLELFARRDRDGWTCLGDECPSDGLDIRDAIDKQLLDFRERTIVA